MYGECIRIEKKVIVSYFKIISWDLPGEYNVKTSVMIAGNLAKIQTGYLPNTRIECYCNTSLFGNSLCYNLKVHYHYHKKPPLDIILIQFNVIHMFITCCHVGFILILSPHLHLGLWSVLCIMSSNLTFVFISCFLPMHATPHHWLHSPLFNFVEKMDEKLKILSSEVLFQFGECILS